LQGKGSPAYIAPEIIGEMPSTTKVDLWSLGIIFYQLITNKHPFHANSMYKMTKLIMESEPAPLP
jgi:serine/threonine protein kinase